MAAVCEREADGIVVAVRLTPRASRDGIDGLATDSADRATLRARVRSPPVDGAANKALVALLARAFGVRKSAVTIISGDTARLKRVRIVGDPDALAEVLATWSPGP